MTGNATIHQIRESRCALNGAEFHVKVLRVSRNGDAGHAVVSLSATRNGVQTWRANRVAVLLDTQADGWTPHLRSRNERARRILRNVLIAIGPHRFQDLSYLVDSCAHFWCADNSPDIYGDACYLR